MSLNLKQHLQNRPARLRRGRGRAVKSSERRQNLGTLTQNVSGPMSNWGQRHENPTLWEGADVQVSVKAKTLGPFFKKIQLHFTSNSAEKQPLISAFLEYITRTTLSPGLRTTEL